MKIRTKIFNLDEKRCLKCESRLAWFELCLNCSSRLTVFLLGVMEVFIILLVILYMIVVWPFWSIWNFIKP